MFATAIAIAAIHAAQPAEVTALPKTAIHALEPYERAHAFVAGETWEISPVQGGPGVLLRIQNSEGTREFDPGFADILGRVAGVAAIGKRMRSFNFVAAICACVSASGREFEYRILMSGPPGPPSTWNPGSREASDPSQQSSPKEQSWWKCSPVVARRPIHDPFDIMSIALPEGDTVFVTLQRFSRDETETVYVRDYCPIFSPELAMGLEIKHDWIDMQSWTRLTEVGCDELDQEKPDQPLSD